LRDATFEAIRAGATLLTASERQARSLRAAFGRRMREAGRLAWPSPDILTWGAWQQRCWLQLFAPSPRADLKKGGTDPAKPSSRTDADRVLLNPVQEAGLWQTLIEASELADGILQPALMAQTAQEAWRLHCEWGVPLPTSDAALNEDVRAFASWARTFDERCRAQGWLDSSRLAETLGEAIEAGRFVPPARLLIYGFDDLTPQQERLLGRMRARGAAVEILGAEPRPARAAIRREFADPLAEIRAAARWARERLQNGVSRIGVVVPDLAALRAQVIRIFDDILVPGAVLPGSLRPERPYNLSLGQTLSSYPVIHTAFQILDLGADDVSCAEVGSLLRSPFIAGAAAEWPGRARLDVACRRRAHRIDIHALARWARGREAGPNGCPSLASRLDAWRGLLDRFPRTQPPSAWAEGFAEGLMALGWPGDRPLDSTEYQTVEAWREVLSLFSSLDEISGRMDYREALSTLRRLAAERIFQPKSADVPVQIMGLLEASGLEFDCLWITGLHDAAWPRPARPNPFIPIELQRRHRLPHSTAARELEFARRLMERLLVSAPEVVVSHPRRSEEEELRPSVLIRDLPLAEYEEAEPLLDLYRLVHADRPTLQQIADEEAPPLPEGILVRRGTGVFTDQAACPFRAFARARLGARAIEVSEPGLDASDRGRLVHAVMERLWAELHSHANLCAASEEALQGLIDRAVTDAIAAEARTDPRAFTPLFRKVEHERLRRLARSWLEIERRRAPFTVFRSEQDQVATFGGVRIGMLPDRIDVLEDGSRVVIDYKTGTQKLRQWFGARPEEPQLLLYGLAQPDLAAIAFAQIRKDESCFIGIAERAGIAPGITPAAETSEAVDFSSWGDLLAHWRRIVDELGCEFRAGKARVEPRDGQRTCQYCDLSPLCRVREQSEAALVDSEEVG
jgi:ATP-dependent helicase/nuclease subunit B